MNNSQETKQFSKTITIIHFAIVTGLVLFISVIFFTTEAWSFIINIDLLTTIGITTSFSSIFISKKVYTTFINRTKNQTSIKDKLTGFQIATIIKLALIEGAGLLNVVLGMISQNSFFLVVAIVVALYLYIQKPTETSIKKELNLF